MHRKTRSNRRQSRRRTRRSKVRIHTYFVFEPKIPVVLAMFVEMTKNKKIYRRPIAFQDGLDFVSDKNMTVTEFNAAVKQLEMWRKKGVPNTKANVYRTTDKTPEEFAAIAKKYGGKETPEWFVKELEFIRNQIALMQ